MKTGIKRKPAKTKTSNTFGSPAAAAVWEHRAMNKGNLSSPYKKGTSSDKAYKKAAAKKGAQGALPNLKKSKSK